MRFFSPTWGNSDATGARRGDGCLPVIRCLAGARPGAKPWCDIDFAASARSGRSARQLAQTVGSWHRYGFRASDNKLRLACHASTSITGCVLGRLLRLRAKTSPLARLPRLTPSAIFIALLAGNRPGTAALRYTADFGKSCL